MIENNIPHINTSDPVCKIVGYEVIILAGGLGTRLRSVVPELPKCMAPVAGRPFLFYLINYLRSEGVDRFIFSLGYKHEIIEEYLQQNFQTLSYKIVIEEEPLGTGGATRLACIQATEKNVLLANGDTMFRIDIHSLFTFHIQQQAACTLSLKPMFDFDRYGAVDINDNGTIISFQEKKHYNEGIINGGLYALNVEEFLKEKFPVRFSFEQDYLEKKLADKSQPGSDQLIYGLIQNRYFIDIGIPSDFQQAQVDFGSMPLHLPSVNKEWTLFLDRDGVINHEKPGSYVFNPGEFIFYEGVLQALKIFAAKFGRIIVVTNQRGIGKGLMTEDDLFTIHKKLTEAVQSAGGRIDGIFFNTSLDNSDQHRKPNPGMARIAKHHFPTIDFTKAIMVGNNPSDMNFGKNAGMYTVFVKTTRPNQAWPHGDIDLMVDSLADFANAL